MCGAGGLTGGAPCSLPVPSLSPCPALGTAAAHRAEQHPHKGVGEQGLVLGVQKLLSVGTGPWHHIPLTPHPVLQPFAVQLQQDLPAVYPQPAGVPRAADHHAVPR